MVILQLIPTIVEVSLLTAVLLWQFDWRYVLVTLAMVAAYLYYTYIATEWRIEIRRRMNDSDTEANTKAIDSLLNYETVKYFGAEAREAERYDRSMERYERASVKTYTSLAVLNAGQAVIFTIGLTAAMLMCAQGVRQGHNTVGDFVMINSMMIQLYQPLNFMGMVYREIKQAIIDIEKRSEEHTSELQSHLNIVCRLLLEKKNKYICLHEHSDVIPSLAVNRPVNSV